MKVLNSVATGACDVQVTSSVLVAAKLLAELEPHRIRYDYSFPGTDWNPEGTFIDHGPNYRWIVVEVQQNRRILFPDLWSQHERA